MFRSFARTHIRVLAGAMIVWGVAPTGVAAQANAPSPPTAPNADPSIRRDFLGQEFVIRAQDSSSVLTVTGEGRVDAPSDRVRIGLAVVTEATSSREAANENTTRMEALTAAVRATGEGADGFELRTRDFSVFPVYSSTDRPQREITGYTVQNTLEVTVDDVLLIGDLLDVALGSGANRVSGLQFEVADPEPHRRSALEAAVASARREAETIAAALGMRVGPAIEVQGGADPSFPFPRPFQAEAMALRDAVPIEPGSQTISANVTIRYRLEPLP